MLSGRCFDEFWVSAAKPELGQFLHQHIEYKDKEHRQNGPRDYASKNGNAQRDDWRPRLVWR